jgi:hypothetical protein
MIHCAAIQAVQTSIVGATIPSAAEVALQQAVYSAAKVAPHQMDGFLHNL